MNDRLQVGIEYDYEENNLLPLLTYRWLEATEDTPAVILGTNSAWPSSEVDGNAVMVTLAQMLGQDTSATVGADAVTVGGTLTTVTSAVAVS